MSYGAGWQIDDRYARRVRRARLCVPAHTPARRLAFTIEEALRLTSLPGENEGRCYYFRYLRITGLPDDGDRQIWLQQFHRILNERAAQAVHGGDARAAYADAVFFAGEQEALELLLHCVIARRVMREWFWPMVIADTAVNESGSIVSNPASRANLICGIIEKLRARPASWLAVAAALFATAACDVVHLLGAIPPAVAESWVAEMRSGETKHGAAIPISAAAVSSIHRALRVFGFRSARTLWLATLSVMFESPAEIAAGTAVSSAERTLQRLSLEVQSPDEAILSTPRSAPSSGNIVALPEEQGAAENGSCSVRVPPPSARDTSSSTAPMLLATKLLGGAVAPQNSVTCEGMDAQSGPPAGSTAAPTVIAGAEESSGAPPALAREQSSQPLVSTAGPTFITAAPDIASPSGLITAHSAAGEDRPLPCNSNRAVTRWHCEGLPTSAAGFFFLLNVLRHLGIAQALATGLTQASPDFLPRLLVRLAAHAQIAADDPILLWLESLLMEETPGNDLLQCDLSYWPANFQPECDTASLDYIIRAWYLGVRRWCWRVARVRVLDIVTRPGVFSVTRTDLDVSLPLDEADVRVRLAGLDLDPGWLPWFGRVVRFHYLEREEFDA